MQTLNFTLTPEGVARVHDAVVCLAKFSEVVGFEAHRDKVGYPILLDFMCISTSWLTGSTSNSSFSLL